MFNAADVTKVMREELDKRGVSYEVKVKKVFEIYVVVPREEVTDAISRRDISAAEIAVMERIKEPMDFHIIPDS